MLETFTIPGYTIEDELGQGGMANVYLAIQESLGRKVALKVMSPAFNADPAFAERFMREARIVSSLSHACIVPVIEVGRHEAMHYLSMEYLPGGDLKDRILGGESGLALASDVCLSVCSALELAHSKGFVHRDIKPANILFREDGTPVLTDFGIARVLDGGQGLTQSGVMIGTPAYMSPEQVMGGDIDGRSDLYTVGVVFYETLTGSAPFQADSSLSAALKHVSEPLPPLPKAFADYQGFVDKLTAKDREARFASGNDVIRALRTLGDKRGLPDPTLTRMRRPTPGSSTSRSAAKPGASKKGTAKKSTRRKAAQNRTAAAERAAPRQRGRFPWRAAGALTVMAAAGGAVWWLSAGGWSSFAPLSPLIDSLLSAPPGAPPPAAPAQDRVPAEGSTPPPATVLAAAGEPLGGEIASSSASASPEATSADPVEDPAGFGSGDPGSSDGGIASLSRSAIPETPPAEPDPPVRSAAAKPAGPPREQPRAEDTHRARKETQMQDVSERLAQINAQTKAGQIKEQLTAAHRNLISGALWQPAGASAADRYRTALRLQPGQPDALSGARRLADVLAQEARCNESAGDIYLSTLLIAQISTLQPSHPALHKLQVRLRQMQAKPAAWDAGAKDRLQRAAAFLAQSRASLAGNPQDPKAVASATSTYDKALAVMPDAPGLPSLKMQLIAVYPGAAQAALSHKDVGQAQKLVADARRRGLSSPELEQVNAGIGHPAPPPVRTKARQS